jgi:hypothetical protein
VLVNWPKWFGSGGYTVWITFFSRCELLLGARYWSHGNRKSSAADPSPNSHRNTLDERITTVIALPLWMRAVGVFYVLLSLLNVRFLGAPLEIGYGWLLFGLDLAIVGVVLIAGADRPSWHAPLLWIVLSQEVIRGILADIYALALGGPPALYFGFIILHSVIIVTALVALRRARTPALQFGT